MCSFVLSQLNYCFLCSLTSTVIRCTGCKKFHAMKVVFCKSRREHVRPLLKALHWLPVKDRIIFKITTFVFCLFDGTLPPYQSCLSVYTPPLSIPIHMKKTLVQYRTGIYSPKMKGANWLKGRSLVNIFSLWNIWYKSVVLSLIWLHSLVCQIHNKQMSQLVAYSGNICVWVVSCNECGGWQGDAQPA